PGRLRRRPPRRAGGGSRLGGGGPPGRRHRGRRPAGPDGRRRRGPAGGRGGRGGVRRGGPRLRAGRGPGRARGGPERRPGTRRRGPGAGAGPRGRGPRRAGPPVQPDRPGRDRAAGGRPSGHRRRGPRRRRRRLPGEGRLLPHRRPDRPRPGPGPGVPGGSGPNPGPAPAPGLVPGPAGRRTAMSILASPSLLASLRSAASPRRTGRVTRLVGLRVEVEGIDAAVGEAVWIERAGSGERLPAEVVAVQGTSLACMPLGELSGVRYGDVVEAAGRPLPLTVGPAMLGRVVDGLGRPIDDGPPIVDGEDVGVD